MNDRFTISGVQVSQTNLEEAIAYFRAYDYHNTGYVCLPDLSVLTTAQNDPKLRHILNHSLQTLPDGKPLELIGRIKGYRNVKTVSGYWLIKALLDTELTHYFLGGNDQTIQKLKKKLTYSESSILGFASPPFVALDEIENNKTISEQLTKINHLKPDIIWIGISSPKQDYLMAHYHKQLSHGIMVGVGGVFDYLAGTKKISPEWVKKIGLRWLYRLIQEPRRLWKKYFIAFTGFIRLLIFSKKG